MRKEPDEKRNKAWDGLRFGVYRIGSRWGAAAWTAGGLSALVLPQEGRSLALRKLRDHLPPLPEQSWERSLEPLSKPLLRAIRAEWSGCGSTYHSFDLSFLTPFQQRVLEATRLIPWGQTRTYGWVAQKAGSPRGFRAAGQALNRNPIPLFIPCHRVIAGGGLLGGYGGGIYWKIKLLQNEGVTVLRGRVVSYRRSKL